MDQAIQVHRLSIIGIGVIIIVCFSFISSFVFQNLWLEARFLMVEAEHVKIAQKNTE
jgi:hypothetical protein